MTEQIHNAPSNTTDASSFMQYAKKLCVCLLYILVSMTLIRFNKFLMRDDQFPFALQLSAIHMLVSSVLCSLLYILAPSMFPAMDIAKDHRYDILKMIMPTSFLFAVALYGTNQAYAYCDVALLQFMKGTNIVLIFLISCAMGLQCLNRVNVALILWILTGTLVAVSGDLKFSLIGIAFQVVGMVAESSRAVMAEMTLKGWRLDPLTFTYFMAPLCFTVLLVAIVCRWDAAVLPAFFRSWKLLTANAFMAFALNVLVATVTKETSAMGFVLLGITKDIALVTFCFFLSGEPVTRIQWAAFSITLGGISLWSLTKIAPDSMPVWMLERALCVSGMRPLAEAGETTTLISKEKLPTCVNSKV